MNANAYNTKPIRLVERPIGLGATNQNPRHHGGLLGLLAEDFRTYSQPNEPALLEPGYWAMLVHRLGNARMDLPKPLRAPATVAYRAAALTVKITTGVECPYTVKLGRRVRFWHQCMVLGAKSIGNDVQLRQFTTLGVVRTGESGKPTIEDGADIGCGASILGPITIGRGARVGAGATVFRNVPMHSIAVGNPARIIGGSHA